MGKLSIALILIFTPALGWANPSQEKPVGDPAQVERPSDQVQPDLKSERKTKYESWYWGFALYSGGIWYGKDTDAALKSLKGLPGYDRTPAAIDLVFTWPTEDRKWTLGVGFLGVVDTIKANGYELSIIQRSLNFSARVLCG